MLLAYLLAYKYVLALIYDGEPGDCEWYPANIGSHNSHADRSDLMTLRIYGIYSLSRAFGSRLCYIDSDFCCLALDGCRLRWWTAMLGSTYYIAMPST